MFQTKVQAKTPERDLKDMRLSELPKEFKVRSQICSPKSGEQCINKVRISVKTENINIHIIWVQKKKERKE